MSSASLSFLLHHPNHSPGKPKCVKPRVRAEPGEPQALISDFLQAFPLPHGLLAANDNGVGVMDNAVTDRVGQDWIGELLQPGMSNWEHRIVEALLYLASIILQKVSGFRFLQGVEKPFVNNQSEYFLYWDRSFRMLPLPLAMLNSTSRSGRRMYLTVRNCLTAAIPSAHAR